MADQKRRPKPKKEEETAQAAETTATEEKDEDLEDLLDEIDEVLEVNAEDFVRGFIQKGGQAVIPVTLFTDNGFPLAFSLLVVVVLFLVWKHQHSF